MVSVTRITKYFFFLLSLSLIQGCWTSENDTSEVDKLVCNFKVIKNKNDVKAGKILSFNSRPGSYEYIQERCEKIYFNSTEIFVKFKRMENDTNYHYCKLLITPNQRMAFQKKELSQNEFHESIEACKDCIEKKY